MNSMNLTSESRCKYALGIDIGGTKMIFLLSDQDGNVIAKKRIPTIIDGDPLVYIRTEVRRFLAEAGVAHSEILGTGMGLPAAIDFAHGVIVNCPALRIENVDVKTYFQYVFPEPLYIDNDVNMAVIGEKWRGTGAGYSDVILVAVGTGLGAGIMFGNKVHRGANGFAGEIGYFHVDPLIEGFKSNSAEFGPLEKMAAGSGIAEQARILLPEYPNSLLNNLEITAENVFAVASKGDELAQAVIERTVKYLAFGITNVVSLLNPHIVVIGGGVSNVGDFFIEAIQQRVSELIPFPIKVVGATLGEDAGALGAAAAVFLENSHLAFKDSI